LDFKNSNHTGRGQAADKLAKNVELDMIEALQDITFASKQGPYLVNYFQKRTNGEEIASVWSFLEIKNFCTRH
jgi:hypothetical protein